MTKKIWGLLLALSLLIGGCGAKGTVEESTGSTGGERAELLVQEKTALEEELSKLKTDMDGLKDEQTALKEEKVELEKELREAKSQIDEFSILEEKYGQLAESEIEAKVAANELKAEEDRKEKERILAEEEAEAEKVAREEAEEAAEKEKKGYETGITFNNIARNPDDYMLEKVKFKGTVVQVIEGGSQINLRFAIGDDYDKVILVYYPPSLLKSRVLEDDEITVYGTSMGLFTYESTMGGEITVPLVEVDRIDF